MLKREQPEQPEYVDTAIDDANALSLSLSRTHGSGCSSEVVDYFALYIYGTYMHTSNPHSPPSSHTHPLPPPLSLPHTHATTIRRCRTVDVQAQRSVREAGLEDGCFVFCVHRGAAAAYSGFMLKNLLDKRQEVLDELVEVG